MVWFKMCSTIICFVIPDERDAIQKKTFTKWVNKHLKKVKAADRPITPSVNSFSLFLSQWFKYLTHAFYVKRVIYHRKQRWRSNYFFLHYKSRLSTQIYVNQILPWWLSALQLRNSEKDSRNLFHVFAFLEVGIISLISNSFLSIFISFCPSLSFPVFRTGFVSLCLSLKWFLSLSLVEIIQQLPSY